MHMYELEFYICWNIYMLGSYYLYKDYPLSPLFQTKVIGFTKQLFNYSPGSKIGGPMQESLPSTVIMDQRTTLQ